MSFTTDPNDLSSLAAAFKSASTTVTNIGNTTLAPLVCGTLESEHVLGSNATVKDYIEAANQWAHAIAQLAASLDTIGKQLVQAAEHYHKTDATNTAGPSQ